MALTKNASKRDEIENHAKSTKISQHVYAYIDSYIINVIELRCL